MATTIRRWYNAEWDKSNNAREQYELQFMFKKIISNADIIENKPTPGSSRDDLSRCIRCKSILLPGTEYIIHVNGFTVEDITELVKE